MSISKDTKYATAKSIYNLGDRYNPNLNQVNAIPNNSSPVVLNNDRSPGDAPGIRLPTQHYEHFNGNHQNQISSGLNVQPGQLKRFPAYWGSVFWFTLHNSSISYPEVASPLFIERAKYFILGIPVMLPCDSCRDHATSYIEYHKDKLDVICNGRKNFFQFFVDFHNYVNARHGKKIFSYEEAYEIYDV